MPFANTDCSIFKIDVFFIRAWSQDHFFLFKCMQKAPIYACVYSKTSAAYLVQIHTYAYYYHTCRKFNEKEKYFWPKPVPAYLLITNKL